MEAAYEKIIGPFNTACPSQSLQLNIWVLKWLGLWPPENRSRCARVLYSIYASFLRIFLLYIYVATQVYFFFHTDNLAGVAEGFITFLTQIALCYKLWSFNKNIHRIKKVLKTLNGSVFKPINANEKQIVKIAMTNCFAFSFFFLSILQPTIVVWIFEPFLQGVRKFPIAARFPYKTDNDLIFGLTFTYQIAGLYLNAAANIASDGVGSGLMALVNGQIQRLGIQLENIGRNKPKRENVGEESQNEQMTEINSYVEKCRSEHGDTYAEWVHCIMFHKCILSLSEEIEDIFKRPIFAQFLCSGIIVCMNCFLIVTNVQETATLWKNVTFLSGVLTQIILFCWIGSEIIFSSRKLSTQAYFSNTENLDRPTAKIMLIFMERTYRDIIINAGSIFRIALSLPTFLAVMQTSYSYLSVMRKLETTM